AEALEVDGPLLGFTDQGDYSTVTVTLAAGERLLLATDGLDPAELASGGPCPVWLTGDLSSRHAAPLETTATRAASRVAARLGPDPQDDWMMVLIERADARPMEAEALPPMAGQARHEPVEALEVASPPPQRPAAQPEKPFIAIGAAATMSPDVAPDGDGPLFQPAGIAALRKAVGEEAFSRLAARFLDNVAEKIALWDAAQDPVAVVAAAHALAGLLGQFGLAGAAARARAVELEPDPEVRLVLARGVGPLARQEIALFQAWFTGGAP
ncbi:MAG: hypothetical protein B7Y75_06340, partial [Azorhizobium sp. 35-67-5]